jgi:formylglycine-generating enzyme
MKKQLIILSLALTAGVCARAQKQPDNFVLIEGGGFTHTKLADLYGKDVVVSNFYIAKYEVTQKEWTDVMSNNPSQFKGDNLPVEMVSWYDCVDYCNRRSLKEGLKPCYEINKTKKDPINRCDLDDVKWTVTTNAGANGYRLPTQAEWEYAASGGRKSKNYKYSGGNEEDKVAWYWRNSGDNYLKEHWRWTTLEKNHCQPKPGGGKEPNELGLYDMSGNVREWCWDWHVEPGIEHGMVRAQKGGCWMADVMCCVLTFRGGFEANGKGSDQGLRLCRGK